MNEIIQFIVGFVFGIFLLPAIKISIIVSLILFVGMVICFLFVEVSSMFYDRMTSFSQEIAESFFYWVYANATEFSLFGMIFGLFFWFTEIRKKRDSSNSYSHNEIGDSDYERDCREREEERDREYEDLQREIEKW